MHARRNELTSSSAHDAKALAVLLQKSFRNIVREPVNRGTADPPPSPADPRPSQFTFSDDGLSSFK